MPLSKSLKQRQCEAEVMDSPDLEASRHFHALNGLARLNALSRSARLVWNPIRELGKECDGGPLRILDLATGSGDLPLEIWRRGRRAGMDVEVVGVDVSERALEHARSRAAAAGAAIRFEPLNALTETLPSGFDVVTCSLFLHHLSNGEAERLLGAMRVAAGRLVVVSDLLRSRRGLILTEAAVRLFTTSDVVRIDGPRSVRAAYSLAEARGLASAAGLRGAVIRKRWPSRFVLIWRPSAEVA